MLEIQDLHVEVDGKEIIKGISLTFEKGKVHALMGPNGSGKSTLAKTIMGHPKYKVTKGKILLDGKDITHSKPDERAKLGLFLSFQHPTSVGINMTNFLRTAVNSKREQPHSVMDFYNILKEKMSTLQVDPSFSRRPLNGSFSGGERKKAEILQMMMLQPTFALLDETDSGLDVDAIKIVAESINQNKEMGMIVITHYNRFLQFVKPNKVTVMNDGKIVKQGGPELAEHIEEHGFGATC
ncbi:MAG: Fe-S cluster assembly ATPase SufC [Nanoarchaeota archaeon]|nr:Fe-S cluster assembly ATPase SufC [Nanoarchaeota archaeon]